MRIRFTAGVAVAVLIFVAVVPAPGQDGKKGVAELQGTWKLVNMEADADVDMVPPNLPRWVIKADKVLYGDETLATLAAEAGATPKTMDLNFVAKDRVYEAIYTVEGDTLKICLNRRTDGVKERPLDFTTDGKPDRRLLTFKREKPGADDGTKDGPGFVGVQIGVAPEDKSVIVVAALDNSPAKKAGLKKDDVIVRVGDTPATGVKQVVDLIREVRPGSEVILRIRRGEKEQDVTVKAGVLPFFLLD
jgi:uncharacterized protein (TIGR03067 family)